VEPFGAEGKDEIAVGILEERDVVVERLDLEDDLCSGLLRGKDTRNRRGDSRTGERRYCRKETKLRAELEGANDGGSARGD
jgi:hypothetical protein